MFKRMKLGMKIGVGFGAMIVLLMTVGILGYVTLSRTTHEVDGIQEQIQIAQKVNNAMAFSQDAQAASLRYIIYQDAKYTAAFQEAGQNALKEMEEAKGLMMFQENRKKTDDVVNRVKA